MNIPWVLGRIRPGADWAMAGHDHTDYAALIWRDETQTKPTRAEVEAAWQQIEAEQAAQATLRQAVVSRVSSLAGVNVTELSLEQLRPLLAALLYANGALDHGGNIKPVREWLLLLDE